MRMNDDLAALDPPHKHYRWYYSTRPANEDITHTAQGVHDPAGALVAEVRVEPPVADQSAPGELGPGDSIVGIGVELPVTEVDEVDPPHAKQLDRGTSPTFELRLVARLEEPTAGVRRGR